MCVRDSYIVLYDKEKDESGCCPVDLKLGANLQGHQGKTIFPLLFMFVRFKLSNKLNINIIIFIVHLPCTVNITLACIH